MLLCSSPWHHANPDCGGFHAHLRFKLTQLHDQLLIQSTSAFQPAACVEGWLLLAALTGHDWGGGWSQYSLSKTTVTVMWSPRPCNVLDMPGLLRVRASTHKYSDGEWIRVRTERVKSNWQMWQFEKWQWLKRHTSSITSGATHKDQCCLQHF